VPSGSLCNLPGLTPSARAKQCHQAAETLLSWPEQLITPAQIEVLTRMPTIGRAVPFLITELITTGRSTYHQQLRGGYPSSLAELGDVLRLSSKQIYFLYRDAGVRSLADLWLAVHNTEHLLAMPGFSPRVLTDLCKALDEYEPGAVVVGT
jgi:DNA polymerase (family 10)